MRHKTFEFGLTTAATVLDCDVISHRPQRDSTQCSGLALAFAHKSLFAASQSLGSVRTNGRSPFFGSVFALSQQFCEFNANLFLRHRPLLTKPTENNY